jgi:hypothetical protein
MGSLPLGMIMGAFMDFKDPTETTIKLAAISMTAVYDVSELIQGEGGFFNRMYHALRDDLGFYYGAVIGMTYF